WPRDWSSDVCSSDLDPTKLSPGRRPNDVRRRCCGGSWLDVPSHRLAADRACHGPACSRPHAARARPSATGPRFLGESLSSPDREGSNTTVVLRYVLMVLGLGLFGSAGALAAYDIFL